MYHDKESTNVRGICEEVEVELSQKQQEEFWRINRKHAIPIALSPNQELHDIDFLMPFKHLFLRLKLWWCLVLDRRPYGCDPCEDTIHVTSWRSKQTKGRTVQLRVGKGFRNWWYHLMSVTEE